MPNVSVHEVQIIFEFDRSEDIIENIFVGDCSMEAIALWNNSTCYIMHTVPKRSIGRPCIVQMILNDYKFENWAE